MDSYVRYIPQFLTAEDAKALFDYLYEHRPPSRASINTGLHHYKLNRLTLSFGDEGVAAPRIWGTNAVHPWPTVLRGLKDRLEQYTGFRFNICLCNIYMSGSQAIGLHADNEEKGSTSCIASISLGAARKFRFEKNANSPANAPSSSEYLLENGSLLLMLDGCQENFRHTLPPDSTTDSRINLTFRLFDAERYAI